MILKLILYYLFIKEYLSSETFQLGRHLSAGRGVFENSHIALFFVGQ